MLDLPSGTVTFLLTDVEGSTRRWEDDPEGMRAVMARHDELMLAGVERRAGVLLKHRGEGDSVFAVFARATDAVEASVDLQRTFLHEPVRVRMAIHTGEAELRDGDYYGPVVNRCARLRAIASGGQTVCSQATHDLVRDALPQDAVLIDLGSHRLKDLSRPEQVFQLWHPSLPEDFPPLRSLDAAPHNLPVQITSFIGRDRELAELRELVSSTHLLTLSGTGGAGKTRLALQVAAELADRFPDGVWLAELAALSDPALVTQAVASAVRLREEPGRELLDSLVDHLRDRTTMLVLDNCEHLVESCAQLADTLLRACPGLTVVATSREALGVPGETIWRVPPMRLPHEDDDPSAIAASSSVRLFVERARAVRPGFELSGDNARAVARICSQLDGIPLAIELAAARIKVLSAAQIAERLDDRFRLLTSGGRTLLPRQQTLRALVDWSYDLLTPDEQMLFSEISVFVGGFGLDAVEAVARVDDILGSLGALADKSLVVCEERPDGVRYHVLETLRRYGAEKLEDPAPLRDAHLHHYLPLAERAQPELHGPDQKRWLALLTEERDNLREALTWAISSGAGEEALRLAVALERFWRARGWLTLGRTLLDGALSAAPNAPDELVVRATLQSIQLALQQGDVETAASQLPDAIARAQHLGDRMTEARAHVLGAMLERSRGDAEAAAKRSEQAMSLIGPDGDPLVRFEAESDLGLGAWMLGDYERAREHHERALRIAETVGDLRGVFSASLHLGGVAYTLGDRLAARDAFAACLQQATDLDDRFATSMSLINLGLVSSELGDLERARTHLEEGYRLARELGVRNNMQRALNNLGLLALQKADYASARKLLTEAVDLARTMGEPTTLCGALSNLAQVVRLQGEHDHTAQFAGEALHIATAIGDRRTAAFCLEVLANAASDQGRAGELADLAERCLALWTELGDVHGTTKARVLAAQAELALNRFDAAAELLDRAADEASEFGSDGVLADVRASQAIIARERGDDGAAISYLRESLRLWSAHPAATAMRLEALAGLCQAEPSRAARLLGAARALREEYGTPVPPAERPRMDAVERTVRQALGQAAFDAERDAGASMPRTDAVAYALGETEPEVPAKPPAARSEPSAAAFVRDGDFWTVTFEGTTVHLKDSKGLRYLAHLLSVPGQEVHSLDLVTVVDGTGPGVSVGEAISSGLSVSGPGDAGELLDPEARRAYKARLDELRSDLDEAEAFHDPERASRAKEEIAFLTAELSRAVGLGGRDRKAGSAAEKARQNVTRAIKAALQRIEQEHTALGAHLEVTVRTGTFCVYSPDPRAPVRWET